MSVCPGRSQANYGRIISCPNEGILCEASGSPRRKFQGDKRVKKVLTRLDISLSAGFLSPLCPVCIGLMLHSLFLDFLSKYLHITIKSKGRSYFRTQGYHLYQTLTDTKQLFFNTPKSKSSSYKIQLNQQISFNSFLETTESYTVYMFDSTNFNAEGQKLGSSNKSSIRFLPPV